MHLAKTLRFCYNRCSTLIQYNDTFIPKGWRNKNQASSSETMDATRAQIYSRRISTRSVPPSVWRVRRRRNVSSANGGTSTVDLSCRTILVCLTLHREPEERNEQKAKYRFLVRQDQSLCNLRRLHSSLNRRSFDKPRLSRRRFAKPRLPWTRGREIFYAWAWFSLLWRSLILPN